MYQTARLHMQEGRNKKKLRALSPLVRLSAKLIPTFADRGGHVVSVTDPYGRILGFLDRSCYFFFQVAPQLYSRG
jgi:CBS-domain-containing membrane protein